LPGRTERFERAAYGGSLIFLFLFFFWMLFLAEYYLYLILLGGMLSLVLFSRFFSFSIPPLHLGLKGFFRKIPIGSLVLAALALRLLWGICYGPNPYGDFEFFYKQCLAFSEGKVQALGYSKTPVTVLIYGTLFKFTNGSMLSVYILNALMGAAQTYLVFLITRRILTSEAAARFSALITALFPSLVMYSTVLSSEMPFTTLLLLSLHGILVVFSQGPHFPYGRIVLWAVFLGFLTAALHLTRNLGILLSIWLLLALLAFGPFGLYRKAAFFLIFLGSTVVFLLPQIVYNLKSFDTFSIQSSKWGSLVLLHGTNRATEGRWSRALHLKIQERFQDKPWTAASQYARRVALDQIKKDPLDFARFALTLKFHRMWCDDRYAVGWSLARSDHFLKREKEEAHFNRAAALEGWKKVSDHYYFFIVFLVLCGLFSPSSSPVNNRTLFITLAGILLITFGLHLIIEVQGRYHFHATFLYAVLAGRLLR
jgi:4-amino-4-deoxy-L-arabinose transferase-like glycosyltransferase